MSKPPADGPKRPLRDLTLHAVVIVGLTLGGIWFCGSSLDDFFAQDDFLFLERTAALVASWSEFVDALGEAGAVDNGCRPVSTTIYFAAMWKAFGTRPLPYHLMNVLIHVGNAALIYAILWSLVRSAFVASVVAALFLSRSLAYVCVFWVSGVQELWSCSFALLFVLALLRYRDAWRSRWLLIATAAYLLGVLSKETVFVLAPAALPLAGAVRGSLSKREWLRVLRVATTMCLIGVGAWSWRGFIAGGSDQVYTIGWHAEIAQRLANYAAWVFDGSYSLNAVARYASASALLGVVLLPAALKRSLPPLSFAPRGGPIFVLLGVVASLPTVFLTDRAPQYYAYLPSAFFLMGLAFPIATALEIRRPARAIVYAVVLAGCALSVGAEKRTLSAKDSLAWIRRDESDSQALESYVRNPEYQWSGGWMKSTARHAVHRLYGDLRERLPGDIAQDAILVLVGWRDISVRSNLRSSVPQSLTDVSTTESMVRVFWGARSANVRSISPFAEEKPTAPGALTLPELPRFLSEQRRPTFLVFAHPLEGSILRYCPPSQDYEPAWFYEYLEVLRPASG